MCFFPESQRRVWFFQLLSFRAIRQAFLKPDFFLEESVSLINVIFFVGVPPSVASNIVR